MRQKKTAIDITKGQKPTIIITGDEICGHDFWPSLRSSLRPLRLYQLCKKIEREIADPKIWNNLGIVKQILEKYVILETKASLQKKKLPQKPRAPLTEAQKEVLRERIAKARAAKKGKKL